MKATPKEITLGDGPVSDTLNVVRSLPVQLQGLNVRLDYLVFEKPRYGLIKGLPTFETLQARLDFETLMVTLKLKIETIKLAVEYDVGQKSRSMSGADSRDSNSNVDSEGCSEASESIVSFKTIFQMNSQGMTPDSFLRLMQSIKRRIRMPVQGLWTWNNRPKQMERSSYSGDDLGMPTNTAEHQMTYQRLKNRFTQRIQKKQFRHWRKVRVSLHEN